MNFTKACRKLIEFILSFSKKKVCFTENFPIRCLWISCFISIILRFRSIWGILEKFKKYTGSIPQEDWGSTPFYKEYVKTKLKSI